MEPAVAKQLLCSLRIFEITGGEGTLHAEFTLFTVRNGFAVIIQ